MLIGNRAIFGIEAGVEKNQPTLSTLWGHMCVWCNGIALGDIQERNCSLYHACWGLAWIHANIDKLWEPELDGLNDEALWNFLDGLLYGFHGDVEIADNRTLEQLQIDSQRWSRFDFLTNWGEQFDHCKAFIFAPLGGMLKILSRSVANQRYVFEIPKADFLNVSADFVSWFKIECGKHGIGCDLPK